MHMLNLIVIETHIKKLKNKIKCKKKLFRHPVSSLLFSFGNICIISCSINFCVESPTSFPDTLYTWCFFAKNLFDEIPQPHVSF